MFELWRVCIFTVVDVPAIRGVLVVNWQQVVTVHISKAAVTAPYGLCRAKISLIQVGPAGLDFRVFWVSNVSDLLMLHF